MTDSINKYIMEIHGDLKALDTKVDSLVQDMVSTKTRFEEHDKESDVFRAKVIRITTIFNFIGFLIGSGGAITLVLFLLGWFNGQQQSGP